MINYLNFFKTSSVGLFAISFFLFSSQCFGQAESPKEDDYFKIMKVPAPEGAILEVGGLCTLPNGDLGVTTRRGDVFIVKNPSSLKPTFQKFASGLHEVLGLAYKNGSFYCVQRGELTKMTDTDNDGVADDFETIYAWPLSGNYHEYSFGPKLAADGSFFVTLNLGFPPTWWNPKSMVPWRGWALHIFEDGRVEPWAAGMRSPCGISMIDDQLFYTDNQGDWVGSGSIMQVKKGAFMGHPSSLVWTNLPQSPLKLSEKDFFAKNQTKMIYDSKGNSVKPENDVNEKVVTEFDMKKNFPELQLPAVWLPHGILGISNSEIVKIPPGSFGPFAGQLLVGDQGQSMVSRVFMEKINGEYQGAAWPFRSGFQSGIVRLAWGKDGSLFAGETNRGWGSAGEATEGIQRLVWNNKIPFEMLSIKAMPDGFEIAFTKPVDKKYALDLASYSVESFIYKYHSVYGSPPVNSQKCKIKGVRVSADGRTARIIVANLRKGYIHNITLDGIRSQENYYSLVHPTAYYTLNNIPEGKVLSLAEVSTKNSTSTKTLPLAQSKKSPSGGKTSVVKIPTYEQVKGLLTKNTCLACHNPDKRQVGPSFKEISTKKYTVEELISLIYTPKPEHWPGYSTPMPPMTNVPKDEVKKIAAWIKSLNK
ncbi:cytochrome c551/c552 [Pedobacter sp. W3I1]|uniref:c-type cytochrome n=1 Tax=Pedobacter sp. W3I1 TaxID=3042291 RepID=UPI00278708F7|nr:c-type cytochrome [Pedobacter sp. W3I1]MDQ0638462.1 cytochrome c551/c552 [Pedobacter sp. W3I1]